MLSDLPSLHSHLLVHNSSESRLSFDDAIRNSHFTAESRKENDELDGVNVVGNKDERGLLVLDQTNDVVEAVLDSIWLLADVLLLLALRDGGGLLVQTVLLLGLGLWSVLVKELKSLCGGVAVEDVVELGDGGRDLQAHLENLALALEADILGPLHHAREVALRLNVGADAIVAGLTLDEGVLRVLAGHHIQ